MLLQHTMVQTFAANRANEPLHVGICHGDRGDVWGYQNYPCTRTVDNLILRLRKKLESDPTHPSHLLTVHGVGYKFVP